MDCLEEIKAKKIFYLNYKLRTKFDNATCQLAQLSSGTVRQVAASMGSVQ